MWDLIDGLAEMRLENTVEVLGRGSSYLTLYVGEGRGIGGAFKLKGGKETEILWLKWPESMLRRRAEKLKKLLKGPRISSGEEVCSFWDGSCSVSLEVSFRDKIDCSDVEIMDSPDQKYCFIAEWSKKERCLKISDAHEGRGLGITKIWLDGRLVQNYPIPICEEMDKCRNIKKCQCSSSWTFSLILGFISKILVLDPLEYCTEVGVDPTDEEKCDCVWASMLAHENYHCEYGKKLIKGEVGKLKDKLKEAIKRFCEKEKKAPICNKDADCGNRLASSLYKELNLTWKEVGGNLDEKGAIKVECAYQKKHGCELSKCKKKNGGDNL